MLPTRNLDDVALMLPTRNSNLSYLQKYGFLTYDAIRRERVLSNFSLFCMFGQSLLFFSTSSERCKMYIFLGRRYGRMIPN